MKVLINFNKTDPLNSVSVSEIAEENALSEERDASFTRRSVYRLNQILNTFSENPRYASSYARARKPEVDSAAADNYVRFTAG